MENLVIKATPKTLEVNCQSGLIEMRGCSISNDPRTFFKPVQDWIDQYLKDPSDDTLIILSFDYIDSASTKIVLEILLSLEVLMQKDKSLRLNWYYDENDPEMLMLGEILCSRIKIPYNYIRYKPGRRSQ